MPDSLPLSLFSPLRVGAFDLAHRIVLPAMTRRRARGVGLPTPLMTQYYAQRASPAGLIISEAVAVSADGLADPREPGLHTAEQVNLWRQVTDAVHARGGIMLAQLSHGSAAMASPRSAPLPDIDDQMISDFRNAAENAGDAGFDGVELRAGSAGLIGPLPVDAAVHAGTRLVDDLVQTLFAVWGPERVGICLAPEPGETAFLSGLHRQGIAYVHLVERTMRAGSERGDQRALCHRDLFPGVLLVSGALAPDAAAAALAGRAFDAAGLGPAFVANPDLPERLRHGRGLARHDPATLECGNARGYTDYPRHDGG